MYHLKLYIIYPFRELEGLLSRLASLTLDERRRSRLAPLFKIKNNLVDIDANKYLTPADSRTRGGKANFQQSSAKSEQRQNLFFPRTIRDWNSLPNNLNEDTKLNSFKRNVNSIPYQPGPRSSLHISLPKRDTRMGFLLCNIYKYR